MATYEEAFNAKTDKAAAARKKYGTLEAFTTAAKAYNQKKYGTTEPTAKAAKFTGGSKTELAKEHIASSKPVEEKRTTAPITETKSNERLKQVMASANAPESLLTGKAKRKAERQERRNLLTENPVDNRAVNKANKAASKIKSRVAKDKIKREKKEFKQDLAQRKGDLKFYKKTGIDLSNA